MRSVTKDDFAVSWLRRRVSGRRVPAQYSGARKGTWFIRLGCAGVLREDISPAHGVLQRLAQPRNSGIGGLDFGGPLRSIVTEDSSLTVIVFEIVLRELRKSQTAAGDRQRPERVNNGCAGHVIGTSVAPQIADDFGAARKSAEVGQQRTSCRR
jgi:hypothetical protein